MVLAYSLERRFMMEQTATFSKSNFPREHAALIASLQLIGPLTPITYADGAIANVPANLTTASKFIVLHGTTNVAEDTSGSGVILSIIPQGDISSLGAATQTYIRTENSLSGLFWTTPVEQTSIISSKTAIAEMPTIPLDGELSPEDREARKKGLALVGHIAQLMQTDEGFHDWFQEGFDEIATGHFVTFSEEGWKEE